MVVGNGLIASMFNEYKKDPNIIIFASGVSNSKEFREEEYQREFNLLKETIINNDAILVYFSTTSIMDKSLINSPYIIHKKNMEEYIQINAKKYIIFRLSQVVGNGGNKNNIINSFVRMIKNNEQISVFNNATRNLIDIEFVKKVVIDIISKKNMNIIVNIASQYNYKIIDILECIKKILSKPINYELLDKGYSMDIDIKEIEDIVKELHFTSKEEYLCILLKKYLDE
jgi:hypothetical protein